MILIKKWILLLINSIQPNNNYKKNRPLTFIANGLLFFKNKSSNYYGFFTLFVSSTIKP